VLVRFTPRAMSGRPLGLPDTWDCQGRRGLRGQGRPQAVAQRSRSDPWGRRGDPVTCVAWTAPARPSRARTKSTPCSGCGPGPVTG